MKILTGFITVVLFALPCVADAQNMLLLGAGKKAAAGGSAPVVAAGSITSASSESATNSYTANKPTGTAVGDVLIACYAGFSSAAATALSGAQAGFTFIGTNQTTDGSNDYLQTAVYYRVVDGSEGSTFTFTQTATGPGGGSLSIGRITGANASPINVSASSNTLSGTTVSFPSVTTTATNTLIYLCGYGYSAAANSGASWAATGPSGFTMNTSASKDDTTASYVTHMGQAGKTQAATGATGTFSATYSNSVLAFFTGWTIAIKP